MKEEITGLSLIKRIIHKIWTEPQPCTKILQPYTVNTSVRMCNQQLPLDFRDSTFVNNACNHGLLFQNTSCNPPHFAFQYSLLLQILWMLMWFSIPRHVHCNAIPLVIFGKSLLFKLTRVTVIIFFLLYRTKEPVISKTPLALGYSQILQKLIWAQESFKTLAW